MKNVANEQISSFSSDRLFTRDDKNIFQMNNKDGKRGKSLKCKIACLDMIFILLFLFL